MRLGYVRLGSVMLSGVGLNNPFVRQAGPSVCVINNKSHEPFSPITFFNKRKPRAASASPPLEKAISRRGLASDRRL